MLGEGTEMKSCQELLEELDGLRKKCSELEDKLEEVHICNRCGRDSTTSPVKVREDIMKKYFRSALGQMPFTHTITAMDGQLSATFTIQRGDTLVARAKIGELSMEEGEKSLIVSTLLNVKVVDKMTDMERVLYSKTQDELAASLTNVNDCYEKLVRELDVIQLSFVRTAVKAFVVLVSSIVDNISSSDFYEGAGLL